MRIFVKVIPNWDTSSNELCNIDISHKIEQSIHRSFLLNILLQPITMKNKKFDFLST